MRGKDLGDGGRGIGVRPRRETGDRRGWDARYTKQCNTKFIDCPVICCISFEWSGKVLRMRGLKAPETHHLDSLRAHRPGHLSYPRSSSYLLVATD